MQTSEDGVQQTELKSNPGSNPFRNPSLQSTKPQQQQPTAIYPQQYSNASFEEGTNQQSFDQPATSDCFGSWEGFKTWMIRWRGSRRLVLVIVAIALLLDNMLLTVVGKFRFLNLLNFDWATSFCRFEVSQFEMLVWQLCTLRLK